jgi:hypothetical protein
LHGSRRKKWAKDSVRLATWIGRRVLSCFLIICCHARPKFINHAIGSGLASYHESPDLSPRLRRAARRCSFRQRGAFSKYVCMYVRSADNLPFPEFSLGTRKAPQTFFLFIQTHASLCLFDEALRSHKYLSPPCFFWNSSIKFIVFPIKHTIFSSLVVYSSTPISAWHRYFLDDSFLLFCINRKRRGKVKMHSRVSAPAIVQNSTICESAITRF